MAAKCFPNTLQDNLRQAAASTHLYWEVHEPIGALSVPGRALADVRLRGRHTGVYRRFTNPAGAGPGGSTAFRRAPAAAADLAAAGLVPAGHTDLAGALQRSASGPAAGAEDFCLHDTAGG